MADKWNVSAGKCWNDTNRGKLKCMDSNLSQFHFVHHKSCRDWPGIEPGPVWWEASDLTAWAVGNLWIYFPWMVISKGFSFVAFFASVEASSVYSSILSSMPVICSSQHM